MRYIPDHDDAFMTSGGHFFAGSLQCPDGVIELEPLAGKDVMYGQRVGPAVSVQMNASSLACVPLTA